MARGMPISWLKQLSKQSNAAYLNCFSIYQCVYSYLSQNGENTIVLVIDIERYGFYFRGDCFPIGLITQSRHVYMHKQANSRGG